MHSCRKLVENVAFFKNLPMPLLMRIVASLKLEMFLVNDVIVKVSTLGDCMYFILTGTVAVYTKSGLEVINISVALFFFFLRDLFHFKLISDLSFRRRIAFW